MLSDEIILKHFRPVDSITNNELFDFCAWYKKWHKNSLTKELFSICCEGVFHLGAKESQTILKRCVKLGYITIAEGGNISISI